MRISKEALIGMIEAAEFEYLDAMEFELSSEEGVVFMQLIGRVGGGTPKSKRGGGGSPRTAEEILEDYRKTLGVGSVVGPGCV